MATIATVTFNNYLGALGTDRPLMYFLVAAVIIVLSTSFFWVTLGQWIGGSLVCYAFFLPFVLDHSGSYADNVFSVMFAAMALVTGFVTYMRVRDYQRRAFDQECLLAELSVTDTLTGARSRAEFLQQAEKAAVKARTNNAPARSAVPGHRPFQALERRPWPCARRCRLAWHVRRAAAGPAQQRRVRSAGW